MNLINELRMLADDVHSTYGHNSYSTEMSKAADELESLERYRTAHNEWIDKTEWVQADASLPAKYLGMHRADVLKNMISELEERCATLTDALRSTAQTLAWMQHGKCRGFSDDLLTTNEALEKARSALEQARLNGMGSERELALRARVTHLENALHHISLCSQNNMSSQLECGRIARSALEKLK